MRLPIEEIEAGEVYVDPVCKGARYKLQALNQGVLIDDDEKLASRLGLVGMHPLGTDVKLIGRVTGFEYETDGSRGLACVEDVPAGTCFEHDGCVLYKLQSRNLGVVVDVSPDFDDCRGLVDNICEGTSVTVLGKVIGLSVSDTL